MTYICAPIFVTIPRDNGISVDFQPTGGVEVAIPSGPKGLDGVSPTIDVTDILGGHKVTITDVNGTEDFNVMDGSVTSVSGKTGAVTLNAGDVSYDSSGNYSAGTVGGALNDVKSAISLVEDSLEYVEPVNKYDASASIVGLLNIANGNVVTSQTGLKTSDFIEIKQNDTVYMTGIKSDNTYLYGTGTIAVLCWYDASKTFIDGAGNTNAYKITANAKYIRFSFSTTGSFGTALIVSLTLNYKPGTVSDITEYFDPYYKNAYKYAEQVEAENRELIVPTNKMDMTKAVVGQLSITTGNVDPVATTANSTDFIEAKKDDVIYLAAISASDTYVYGTSIISVICEYDNDKNFLNVYSTFTNGYTVQSANAKYIRLSYTITGAFGTAKVISVTINTLPASVAEIERYFPPYYVTALEIANEALKKAGGSVNDHVIDCWGDSRTEMVAADRTSYCDYLLTLLGSSYQTTNYGISSQASGMCAARLGSNEVFVTLENNRINASGASNITAIYVTSGLINNFFCYSTAAGMPCSIKGIQGKIYKTVYNNYTSCAFVRDEDGISVSVKPRTKANVVDENSKNHACILWWGKNDMLTASSGRGAVKLVYADAVNYLAHDKFIILGETCSLTSLYESGQTLRTWLDSFNAEMAALYPNNFIDINAWLSSVDALTSVGLTPTEADTANIAKGWPCESLMVYSTDQSDKVHPNEYGRQAIANKIYAWMQEKNWI